MMFTQEFIDDVTTKMNSGEYGTLDLFKMFLDRKAETDKDFAPLYAKENKSLENCWKYITQECRKASQSSKSKNAFCTNIFKLLELAFHYYCEDSIDEELKEKLIPHPTVAVSTATTTPLAPIYSKGKKKSNDTNCKQLSLFDL